MTNMRNERDDITIDSTDMKEDNKGMLWTKYANKFDNLGEMDKFLKKKKKLESLLKKKHILEMDSGDGCTLMWRY